MDEAVWAAFGIICAVIGLGIIANTFLRGSAEMSEAQLDTVASTLANTCTQVCRLPENTAISTRVELPRDSILSVVDDRVCITSQDGTPACGRCPCTHETDGTILDLTDSSAFFTSHTYSCRYERLDTGNTRRVVRLDCTG